MANKGENFELQIKHHLQISSAATLWRWDAARCGLLPHRTVSVCTPAPVELASPLAKADALLHGDLGTLAVSIKKFSNSSLAKSLYTAKPSGLPTLFNASLDSTPALFLLPQSLRARLSDLTAPTKATVAKVNHDAAALLLPFYDPLNLTVHTEAEMPSQLQLALGASASEILLALYLHHFLSTNSRLSRVIHQERGKPRPLGRGGRARTAQQSYPSNERPLVRLIAL